MILYLLIALPFAGGLLAWAVERFGARASRAVAILTLAAGCVLVLLLTLGMRSGTGVASASPWLSQFRVDWIPSLGISFYLAVDGLSLILVALTYVLGLFAVLASFHDIRERLGFFHFNLLLVLAALVGVFMSLDLVVFYIFFELMLVPMYFLIILWGHERRVYAGVKFFIFTQAGGLLMLVSILALYFIHSRATGTATFNYIDLLSTPVAPATAFLLMLGFFLAFAVKLPAFPLHTWLPDAHTEAPTAGSVVLAGLLIKVGAYGLIRFMIPLFPSASFRLAPVGMALAVIGILYGAILAFAQTDLKRLVAYTSISHMGFVLLGIFAWNRLALQGAVLQMVCHAFSTGALFILVGQLQERTETRDMDRMGGLWAVVPRFGAVTVFFALASLGLPGIGNFIAELLILIGSYQASPPAAIFGALGLITSTIYAVKMLQRVLFGPNAHRWSFPDLSPRELAMSGFLILFLLWIGLYPRPLLRASEPAIDHLQQIVTRSTQAAPSPTSLDLPPLRPAEDRAATARATAADESARQP